MNTSRFALAGLFLGVVLLGLLPTPDPLSPVAEGPTPDQGQLGGGALAAEPGADGTIGLLRPAGVRLADEWLHEAWGAGDPPDAPVATCPDRDAQTTTRAAPGQPGEEPIGQLRLAELRLVRMLASWRGSSSGKASRTRGVLRQPPLEDLAGLTPPADLDELAKLVSYRDPSRDQLRVASTEEPSSGSMPGLIILASYDEAVPLRRGDPGGGSDTAASDSGRRDHARTLPRPAPLTRWGIAIREWIAQRFGRVAGRPDRQSPGRPVPPPGDS